MTRRSLSTRMFKLARLLNRGRHVRRGPKSYIKHRLRVWVVKTAIRVFRLN